MQYFQTLVLIIFLCVAFAGCSSSSSQKQTEYIQVLEEIPQHIQEVENLSVFPGDSEPIYSIELIAEQTFGKSGEPYLTRVQDCRVDGKGRVIIQDFDKTRAYGFPNKLYAYNSDGSFHTQLGGPGRGPGEYGFILNMQAKAGKVIIFDFTNKRLNTYNTHDYSYERSILLERFKDTDNKAASGFEFGYVRARMDGNYLVTFSELTSTGNPEVKYLLMDTDGNVLNFEPLVFPSSRSIRVSKSNKPQKPSLPLLFLGQTLITLTNDGALYSVWTRDFLIKKYDAKGVYQSAIYYPIQGPPFDLQEYAKAAPFSYKARDIGKAFEKMDEELPKTIPVIADMKVDDENRIWVAVPTGVNSENYEWWILKESGELLAKLTLPREQPIYDIKNGYLYSKKTNEETGSEYAIKYRIALMENNEL